MHSDGLRCSALVILAAALSGCGLTHRTYIYDSASTQFPATDDSLDFWDALESQAVTTNEDALHGLILLTNTDQELGTWDEQVQYAYDRGWIAEGTDPPPPQESAQMGFIAVCVCDVLNVRGGLSMQLLGPTPRYCTRELVHMGLLPGITEHEALTGAEFTALLASVEQRQRVVEAKAARAAQSATPSGASGASAPKAPDASQQADPSATDQVEPSEPTS